MKMKNVLLAGALIASAFAVAACTDADTVSANISKAADQFEVNRRVVFLNGITDSYILSVEGLCSLGNYDSAGRMSVTCKIGPREYVKHYLGLSDNVTFFAEQIETVDANPYHYRVLFRPQSILPDIDFQGDAGALVDAIVPDDNN